MLTGDPGQVTQTYQFVWGRRRYSFINTIVPQTDLSVGVLTVLVEGP